MPGARPCSLGVVEHDEIDIARIVELMRAELAHAEDDIALGRAVPRRADDLACVSRLAKQKADGLLDRCLGARAHGKQHLLGRPDAAKVGEPD